MKEYGFVDYEGQTYKSVEINAQVWMAENLNYKPAAGKSKCYAEGKGNHEDDWLTPEAAQANCAIYGRLYDWATAMNLPSSCNAASCASQIQSQHQGICPPGWHIPDTMEWNALKNFIAQEIFFNYEDEDFGWDVATKLKNVAGWKTHATEQGVDSYGFGAIGSGYCVSCEELSSAAGYYSGEKEEAHWWSATEYLNKNLPSDPVVKAYKSKITYNKNTITQEFEKKIDYLYSVRCIKN